MGCHGIYVLLKNPENHNKVVMEKKSINQMVSDTDLCYEEAMTGLQDTECQEELFELRPGRTGRQWLRPPGLERGL